MKKINSIVLAVLFLLAMLIPSKSMARTVAGNYYNDGGCLVVWSYETAFFGLIKYNKEEVVFC